MYRVNFSAMFLKTQATYGANAAIQILTIRLSISNFFPQEFIKMQLG